MNTPRHPCREPLSGPFVWGAAEIDKDPCWTMAWEDRHIGDIEDALKTARAEGMTWQTVRREGFPLGVVGEALSRAAEELENGRGTFLFTGLPVERYEESDLRLIWMGLARHLGTPVHQDCNGQMMRDIQDEADSLGERYGSMVGEDGKEFLSSKARTYGNGPLRFHTDRTDVVALLSVRPAKTGGLSKIASVGAVHNAILQRRPDLLEVLYQPIYRSRLGEERGGESMAYPLPVFGLRDGKLTSHYSRTYIEAAQLMPDTPRMTRKQWEAIDMLARVAEECCHEMLLGPGDIQLLNNHVVYHARTAFCDHESRERKRLLYRLWLCMPNNRALPRDHAVLWGNIEAESLRGGIAVTGDL